MGIPSTPNPQHAEVYYTQRSNRKPACQPGHGTLHKMAKGIRLDYAAVKAAFSSEWSNGQVEAQVNCLKLQKRIVFGRANFDLLRLRVLCRV
ncbi:transposase [Ktedonobacter sp. SOSP1-85]|uniref:transposase n=1 Tax=Ktedonobacter sp. SOSP1-85 TaxID=2778367 RepID=UPI002102D532|nr:transposase [Ktedonobacter sp. SOSP1-85]